MSNILKHKENKFHVRMKGPTAFLFLIMSICSVSAKDSNYYSDVSSTMPDIQKQYSAFLSSEAFQPTIAELTGDKYPEIIIAPWAKQKDFGMVTDGPTNNVLIILSRGPDGIYKDIASDILSPQAPTLSGVGRMSAVGDINGDGLDDVVWSNNREDGRNQSNREANSAQTSILLSNGKSGRYSIVVTGPYNWHHGIALAPHATNLSSIALPLGFNNSVPTSLVWNGFSFVEETIPNLVYQPTSLASTVASHLPNLDDPATGKRYFYVEMIVSSDNWMHKPAILSRNSSGLWSIEASYLNPEVNSAVKITYTNWSGMDKPGFAYNCRLGLCLGVDESYQSKLWRPTPSSAPLLSAMIVTTVPTVDPFTTKVDELKTLYKAVFLRFYRFNKNEIAQVEVPVVGEKVQTNAYFDDVLDFNNDGYDDIAIYPVYEFWKSGSLPNDGLPIVYLNDKRGGLYRADLTGYYPDLKGTWGLSSRLADLNADGLLDLFVYPAVSYGSQPNINKRYSLYLANGVNSSVALPTYPAPNVTLTTKITRGNGSVTSDPAGISCGSICSYKFTKKMKVKLIASPASGAKFGGWSGGCTGKRLTCSVKLKTSKSVKAKFN